MRKQPKRQAWFIHSLSIFKHFVTENLAREDFEDLFIWKGAETLQGTKCFLIYYGMISQSSSDGNYVHMEAA